MGMSNRDDLNSSPSPTQQKQAELRAALYLSDDLNELGDSNAAYLFQAVIGNRNVLETAHLINMVERAKSISRGEV
jgi:hypothetical protein